MAEALLVTRNDIVKFTALNGNVDTDNFIQWVKVAQDIHIQNFLGTRLFERIKDDIINSQSGFGEVTTATIDNAGTGYTTALNVATTGGLGTGLTFDIVAVAGVIVKATINNGGSGYKALDIVDLVGGNSDAQLIVNAIDEIPINYRTLLVTYVKPMIIHYAMMEYLPFAAYTISNKGVYKHNSENSTNVEKNEVDYLVEKEKMIAQHYTERMIDYINFNISLFPEYNTNANADMFPDTQNNYTGWFI
jgi:hypothetical protein